ncbi:TolC family outer membrane protein [Phreatobacter sp.]|uniref:TolC family outer membrane protein n=1 Tax=Phreatobacter sp. TaxID=1966341 RepID=UPI0022C26280|nr:TolC family outer membrane protein [Phreatobacter sp.]MCZ8313762.1 TolC family outer membrane protein [Phreatobacter sp.]
MNRQLPPRRSRWAGASLIALAVAALAAGFVAPAIAEGTQPRSAQGSRPPAAPVGITTLEAALARAFATNPDIQAQRGQVRATAESIAQARAAGLPQVSATAYAGVLATRETLRGTPTNTINSATVGMRGVGLVATQSLFDGGRTQNSVIQAQRLTEGQRQQLRAVEQSILLDVAASYVAVLTGHALVDVQRRNIGFLNTTLSSARTRLSSGVATPTDVAQAEARLSRGQADLAAAEADLQIARDRFARLVGAPAANQLRPVRSLDALLPSSRDSSRDLAGTGNPAVLAATEQVRAADAAVRIAQGQMLPQLSMQGAVARDLDTDASTRRTDSAQLTGRLTVPLYAGGGPEAQVRQAQELLGAARLQLDSARLQARSAAYAGYTAYLSAGATIRAATTESKAAEVSVDGMQKQVEAGVRTLVELLNAQQDLTIARGRLIQAQGDRIVATFSILAATGRLEPARLGIASLVPAGQPVAPARSDWEVRGDAWRDLRVVPPAETPRR